jgi:plasmid stability protein
MTNLTIQNIPDELMVKIQQRAEQENQSFNQQIINLLNQAIVQTEKQENNQLVTEILNRIEARRQKRQIDIQWLDSTELLREDRER